MDTSDVSDLNDFFFSGSIIVNFLWGDEQMSTYPCKKPTKDQRNIIQVQLGEPMNLIASNKITNNPQVAKSSSWQQPCCPWRLCSTVFSELYVAQIRRSGFLL